MVPDCELTSFRRVRTTVLWLLLTVVTCSPAEQPATPAPVLPPAPVARVGATDVNATLAALLAAHPDCGDGKIYQSGADYVDRTWFGIALVTVTGEVFMAGDAERTFPIQSTAKPFTYGLALEDHGLDTMLANVGVNATGLPFDSLIAAAIRPRRLENPMVSAGAISTTAMIRGKNDAHKWRRVNDAFARYAGADVSVIDEIYDYEIAHSGGSRALAYSLLDQDLFHVPCGWDAPPDCFEIPDRDGIQTVVTRYLKSTSQMVSARLLATMAATLANAGTNPITGERALRTEHVPHVLSAMVTAGMYDSSGEWFSRAGLPAKSGVSGNVIAVVPGRFGVAVYSPPLDSSGNSVRGVAALRDLSDWWGLHLLTRPAKDAPPRK